MSRTALIAVAAAGLAGCGGARHILEAEEMPAGTCAHTKLGPGESCTQSASDYSAGGTVTVPHDHTSELGGNAWFRWTLVDVELDERTMRKGTLAYHSIAGGVGTHLRPLYLVSDRANRYVDPVVDLGLDLGGIRKDSHFEGRGDAYVAVALDLYAPDFGPLRYLETGVPGLRLAARYTAFVNGWESDTTVELGLVWRWGDPIDIYKHWTWTRGGD